LQKRRSTCDETGLSVTTIATNALVKDHYFVIVGSNATMVAPCNKQCCLLQKQ
jgi:hypothetical protein